MARIFHPRTNYCILSNNNFISNLVTQHIMTVNSEAGVFVTRSIFGDYIICSDTEEPLKMKYVISKVPRSNPLFKTINIDENWVDVLYEVEKLTQPELKKYLKKSKEIEKYTIEKQYQVLLVLAREAIINGEFNSNIADRIIDDRYKVDYSYADKMRAVINFVNGMDSGSFAGLMKIFRHNSDYPTFVSIIEKLVTNDLPSYIVEEHRAILNGNSQFLRNLLRVAVTLLKSGENEDFVLHLIKLIQNK